MSTRHDFEIFIGGPWKTKHTVAAFLFVVLLIRSCNIAMDVEALKADVQKLKTEMQYK